MKSKKMNEEAFFELLLNLKNEFNLPINIYSNINVDIDLCYCIYSKNFIKDEGGFSDLMEKLNKLNKLKNNYINII